MIVVLECCSCFNLNCSCHLVLAASLSGFHNSFSLQSALPILSPPLPAVDAIEAVGSPLPSTSTPISESQSLPTVIQSDFAQSLSRAGPVADLSIEGTQSTTRGTKRRRRSQIDLLDRPYSPAESRLRSGKALKIISE